MFLSGIEAGTFTCEANVIAATPQKLVLYIFIFEIK